MPALDPVSLKAIRETQGRLTDTVLRTPLVRLNVDDSAAEIFLKLENLQPIGSFELRGAGNAMQLAKKNSCRKEFGLPRAGMGSQG